MMNVTIRPAAPADAERCASILYEAFKAIADQHNFPPDFASVEDALDTTRPLIAHPKVYSLVAECEGEVVGSIFLYERDPVRGYGPMSVDSRFQGRGIGRQLVEATHERARNAISLRGVQDAFNVLSMSLYTLHDWIVKEPLLLMTGRPKSAPVPGIEVRRLQYPDLGECNALCTRIIGFPRANELRDVQWIPVCAPYVAVRDGRITAYLTAPGFWSLNHGVAETEEDMRALLVGAAAATEQPLSLLVPTRDTSFFRWCLDEGLRAISPKTLMVLGEYRDPDGCYFPSVLY